MNIKILGTGCRKCKKLEDNTRLALKDLGLDASLEKVEDIKEIATYGLMKTPALIVDEELKSYGKLLSVEKIKEILKD